MVYIIDLGQYNRSWSIDGSGISCLLCVALRGRNVIALGTDGKMHTWSLPEKNGNVDQKNQKKCEKPKQVLSPPLDFSERLVEINLIQMHFKLLLNQSLLEMQCSAVTTCLIFNKISKMDIHAKFKPIFYRRKNATVDGKGKKSIYKS